MSLQIPDSLAPNITRIVNAKTAIKNAINAKGGTLTNEKIDEFADAIDALEITEMNRVRYIDYDGTVLKTMYVADGGNATPPANPTHDRLTFVEWNNASTNIQQDTDIGAVYTTASGNTEVDLRLTVKTGKAQTFNLQLESGELTIDWGDGNTDTLDSTGSKSPSHTYADYGEYTVTFEISEGGSWYPRQYFVGNETSRVFAIWFASGITQMQTYTFAYAYGLMNITLPNTLTALPEYVFQYSRVSYVVIPASVTTMASRCFRECYCLGGVALTASVTTIPNDAFTSCGKLTEIVIPSGVTDISSNAFYSCGSIHRVVFPTTLASIGNYAFYQNYSLEEAMLPDSVTSVGEYAFYRCYAMKRAHVSTAMTVISSNTFQQCYALTEINFPEGLTRINSGAFSDCNLAEVDFPSTLTRLESDCFYLNRRLKRVEIPESVTYIGSGAFYECYNIREYIMNSETPPTLGSTSAFSSINYSCLIRVPRSDGLTVLNAYQTASNWSYYADWMVEKEA